MKDQPQIGRLMSPLVAAVVVPLDWFSKYLTHRFMEYGDSNSVVDGLFNLVHVHNYGSAFGMFNQGRASGFNTWFFAAASLVGLFLLIYLIRQEPEGRMLALFSLGLLLGGLIGNQGERFYHSYVTDFLDIYVGSYHWPAFNVADSAISLGIIGYMISMLKREKR